MLANFWLLVLTFEHFRQSLCASGTGNSTNNECLETICLKCGFKGCIKCPNLIVYPTRKCVSACPFGHRPTWSPFTDYMGLVCTSNGNFMGLSSELLSILTGILVGIVFSAIIIIFAIFYVKYRRKKSEQIIESNSDIDDSPERRIEFFKRLDTFRPFAQTFLGMLNDTRKQLRELHNEGDTSAISAYRPVIRDLAKILLLLNRKPESINVPDDYEHLFNWAQKTLKRYKRMSGMSHGQVAQLINFLQGPVSVSDDLDNEQRYLTGSTTMSTFKPDKVRSTLSLQDLAVRNFNSNYDNNFIPPLNPEWKFEYSLVSNNTSEFNPTVWKNSKEYLNSSMLFDDDFCQFGFRPQDEITTEL